MKKQFAVLFPASAITPTNPYYIIVQSWPVHTAAK